MIQYHQNLFVSTLIIICFLPFLWSMKTDKETSTSVQGFTGHSNDSKLSSSNVSPTSSSSVNLINSVQSESNILNTTTTTLPLSTLSPSSVTTKPSSSSSSTAIINNSGSSKSTDQFSYSINNSTLDRSLSTATTTINDNITRLVSLSESPESKINSTIISSQSLSTSQSQHRDEQQQRPTETPDRFPPQLLEFVGLLAFVSLVAIFVVTTGIYGCVKVYHSRYPARITFGRKFSTFENPIYVQKASSSGEIENPAGPMAIEIYN